MKPDETYRRILPPSLPTDLVDAAMNRAYEVFDPEWRQDNLSHPAIAAITLPGALSFHFMFELGIDLLSVNKCLRYGRSEGLGYEIRITETVLDILGGDKAANEVVISRIVSGVVEEAKNRLIDMGNRLDAREVRRDFRRRIRPEQGETRGKAKLPEFADRNDGFVLAVSISPIERLRRSAGHVCGHSQFEPGVAHVFVETGGSSTSVACGT